MDSIKQVWEKVEENLIKSREDFAKDPSKMAEFERSVHKEFNDLERYFIAQTFEDWDNQIRGSLKRLENWVVVRRDKKELVTMSGTVIFNKTLFKNKK